MGYFPLLGAVIGVWAAAIFDAAASLWPPLVAAAISSGGTLWLTAMFVLIFSNVWQTSSGPFSVVSKPIFASKYSFESSC